MAKHCAMLPSEDTLHISAEELKDIKGDYHRYDIRFINAYHLACKNGLKAAMERQHRFETKVLDSASEIAAVLDGHLQPLRTNVLAAEDELKKNLTALRKDVVGKKRAPGENELRKGVLLLKQLGTDLSSVEYQMKYVCAQIKSTTPNILQTERYVTDLKRLKKTLVARYKAHRSTPSTARRC